MGYIKTLKNNELIGGTDETPVYPVSSTQAIYSQNDSGDTPEGKPKKLEDRLQSIEETLLVDAGVPGYVQCSINGSPYLVPVFAFQKPAAPTITANGDSTMDSRTVTFDCSTSGAVIHYTTNEDDPTAASPTGTQVKLYARDEASSTLTIKAIAVLNGIVSDVTTATVIVSRHLKAPTISIQSGTDKYSQSRMIEISSADDFEGKEIWYTTDGTDPRATVDNTADGYDGPFEVSQSCTIKAYVKYSPYQPSEVSSLDVEVGVKPVTWGLVGENGKLGDVVWTSGLTLEFSNRQLSITPSEQDYESFFRDTDIGEDMYAMFALRYPKSYGPLSSVTSANFPILDGFAVYSDDDYYYYVHGSLAAQKGVNYIFKL